MKKLSLYVFLVLMVCNVGFAKDLVLECDLKVIDQEAKKNK